MSRTNEEKFYDCIPSKLDNSLSLSHRTIRGPNDRLILPQTAPDAIELMTFGGEIVAQQDVCQE